MARLRDVADLAGVSPGTASKVLNGRQGQQHFSPECEARIRRAARRLGYRPNYLARNLASGRAEAVGLLVQPGTTGTGSFWGQVVSGLSDSLAGTGRHLVTIAGRSGEEQVDRAALFLEEGRVDGLALLSVSERFDVPPSLTEAEHPMVLLGCEDPRAPSVAVDDAAGVAAAVRHLADLGHRRLLWLGPDDDPHSSVARRRRACRRAAAEAGVYLKEQTFPWMAPSERGPRPNCSAGQIACVRAHCARRSDIREGATAVVCYDDVVACGLYAAAHERGLSIPEDLSVVGFDDLHAEYFWPPLTTASHMLPETGRRAGEILQEMIDGGLPSRRSYAGRLERLAPRLTVRGSTAAPGGTDSQL